MLPLAGQTTGPIEPKFFVDSPGCYRLRKNRYIFFNFFFHGQRRAFQLVLHKFECIVFSLVKTMNFFIFRHKYNYRNYCFHSKV